MEILAWIINTLLQWYVWIPIVLTLAYLTWRNNQSIAVVKNTESVLLVLEIPKANDKSELAAEQLFASLHGILRDAKELKENGGYHAAKDEQGKIEARIRTLTALLKDVKVGEAPQSSGVVETGTVITATIAGDEATFLLGNREIAAGTDYTVYSESSPMGAAILGLKVGEKTTFTAPNGNDIEVKVINVETFTG